MKFILGTKQQMTQVFDEEGRVYPATVLKIDSLKVSQIKTSEKDGYKAVQVGMGSQKKERLNKPQQKNAFRLIREFRDEDLGEFKVGDSVDLGQFEEGDKVQVSAISKGKGFQGVVKRYGFHGGPRTHGQKHTERAPGSIGATAPQRVFKGKKMPGRMGGDRVTVKNLKVLQIDKEKGLLLISGAIPGRKGTLVEVRG